MYRWRKVMISSKDNIIINGFPEENDRRWTLKTPEFDADIYEYNWELTGFDSRLANLDPEVFIYGASVWYITGAYAQEKDWIVIANKRNDK
jgi:GH43 family beta-xylosidase